MYDSRRVENKGSDQSTSGGIHVRRGIEALRHQPDDHPIAKTLNAAKKYVASRTLTMLHWNNSTLLHGDVVSAIIALKAQPGPDLQMIGSSNLIQTLQAASLIDEYNVWTFPVVIGRGKRLFSETAKPSALRLVRSQVSTTGVVMSTYVPSGDYPARFVPECRAEREGVGPTQKDGE
jgi:dihydrofolate reductase